MELPVISNAPSSGGGCSSSGCGSSSDAMAHLPDSIRQKVQDHPCYSEDAHHYFARMHVAVAPACNIQCNYCNRKYDCANESRPGVVSELLHPDQAVTKVLAVAATIPQMTVLGIAGPGDPLANPARTFETFRQLSDKAPDIKLCLSTNGLTLPEHVDEIAKHNIDHVTITINCVDPEIGAQIYPWIYWQNRRLRGVEAARILIEQQQKGLEMLTSRGILVKVNSVMIPGVNDEHLKEVSKVVKAKGAFLHNVMPLIAEAEHGTYYGLMEQPSPTPEQLQALQDECGGDMAMMRHCRQCRADAVGLLGEDRGAEFTLDKLADMDIDYEAAMQTRQEVRENLLEQLAAKRAGAPAAEVTALAGVPADSRPVLMAVAAKNGVVGEHFGHAREFLVYEASPKGVRLMGHRKVDLYCNGATDCGDSGEGGQPAGSILDQIIHALSGCEQVLCARIGFEPWGQLEAAGIQPNGEHAMEPVEDAVLAVYREMSAAGKLAAPADKLNKVA
ncbi:nitrogenase cofactor biosynthesis protein NifB [Rivihabitans pingtungensis]|uniref:FeMo cofactor biosynthesis protein NifB n=1 Tax=Rivihabitans pingtungensis TaxID=1054498 RepID=A0A318KSD4_9NEIS|nr:nitrogenase cofactor biosynthesis protein NifB [Rivihabitans pingtungensis]MCK6438225.1 nitrogenase cofactor biosynthesis protein NifB [Rivihabitans pingtungensis]PXX79522.1 nitrogen fixation protein NifB [Rivihabitans pingtungensis]